MAAPTPNSADRRAWLRTYHYYRSKLMEEETGAATIDALRPLIEADGAWTAPVIEGAPEPSPPPPPPQPGKKPKIVNDTPKNLPPPALAGTPAGIHHALPFYKEGRMFADPWRLPEKATSILHYFAREALAGSDADLLIPEPTQWRDWVAKIDGNGYGLTSLRGLDILRGLRMASILSELERSDEAPIVWQIGPSAATARIIQERLPRVRTVITCEPWEMVSPVTFLKEAMPDASVTVLADPATLPEAIAANDFVFVPTAAIGAMQLPRLDLVLDAMSLLLRDEAVATAHAKRAHEIGAKYVYLLTIDGESPVWPLQAVRPAFMPYFWTHQLPLEGVVDWQMATMADEGFIARGYLGRPEDIKYWRLNPHFTMGWRRLKT